VLHYRLLLFTLLGVGELKIGTGKPLLAKLFPSNHHHKLKTKEIQLKILLFSLSFLLTDNNNKNL
jgi:hypothetical protein